MRGTHLALFAAFALLFATSCGGGGTSTSTGQASQAVVTGKVTSRDGTTTALAGVSVQATADGLSCWTDVTGAFRFDLRAGLHHFLRFLDPLAGAASGTDGSDELDLGDLQDGDTCELEVELAGGRIVEAWFHHHRMGTPPGAGGDAGDAPLHPPEGPNGIAGRIDVTRADGCVDVTIDVRGFERTPTLELVLASPAGDRERLGSFDVQEDGTGTFTWEACDGDTLPLGAETLADLAGDRVLLVDADGNVVLEGLFPGAGPQHDDMDHCHGLARLLPPEGTASDAAGELGVKVVGDCSFLALDVVHADADTEYHVVIVDADGNRAALGSFTSDERGLGAFLFHTCTASDLPFRATTLADLAGLALEVVDGERTVLVQGRLPAVDEGPCGASEPPPATESPHVPLLPPADAADQDPRGELWFECADRCCALKIAVRGFSGTQTLTVLYGVEGVDERDLGTLDVGADGTGRFSLDLCQNDLPVWAAVVPGPRFRLADRAGRTVLEERLDPRLAGGLGDGMGMGGVR